MKQEQRNVLKQLKMAIDRAQPLIHAPITSDESTYLNMIELRGYLDAIFDALEANSLQCDVSNSTQRSLRAGMDLSGRMGICKKYCIDIANALMKKDEQRLRTLRVRRPEPTQILGKTRYGDPKDDKEEDKEYLTQLDDLLTDADRYIETLIAKWLAHFRPRYIKFDKAAMPTLRPTAAADPMTIPDSPATFGLPDSPARPSLSALLAVPAVTAAPAAPARPDKPGTFLKPAIPVKSVKPARKLLPSEHRQIMGTYPKKG